MGVHFRGSAKNFMSLANAASGVDGVITRAVCAEHQEPLARQEAKAAELRSLAPPKSTKPIIHRIRNKLRLEICRLIQEST